jgi:hypothetical protein
MGDVDVSHIASVVLTGEPVWTLDEKLAQAADALHIKS